MGYVSVFSFFWKGLLFFEGFVNLRPFVMKTDIHPKYYPTAKIVCACGNTFTVGSTVEEIHVELCSACHPFYTGQQKFVDTARRVEKFEEKKKAKETKSTVGGKKVKTAKRAAHKAEKKAKKVVMPLEQV